MTAMKRNGYLKIPYACIGVEMVKETLKIIHFLIKAIFLHDTVAKDMFIKAG